MDNIITITITCDNRKWALTNWEEIMDWYQLPFYKRWFRNPPTKEFIKIK